MRTPDRIVTYAPDATSAPPQGSRCRRAVVLAFGLNGLGALRSLHAAGIEAITIVNSAADLPAHSRYRGTQYVVPDDERWEENVQALLLRIAGSERMPVLACSDRAAEYLRRRGATLGPSYAVLAPPADIIECLNDKRREMQMIAGAGLAVPDFLADIGGGELAGEDCPLPLPVIVKPRTFADYARLGGKNLIVRSQCQWRAFRAAHHQALDRFVAQRVIDGDDTHLWVCNATADRAHRIVAAFCFRRLGTAPSHYGVTSLARSESNPRILALVQAIASELRYCGPLMVEFKYEPCSDTYFYIETNPRLGMCNWFDTSCGINNVEASCLLALGEPWTAPAAQHDGRIFWHVLADLVARLEDREPIGSIVARYWSLRGLPKVWAIHDGSDPRPLLHSFVTWSRALGVRAARRLARALGIGRGAPP